MAECDPIKRNIDLSHIIDPELITRENDFNYAGVTGTAETVGYKIIFFKAADSPVVDAIRLFDIGESERKLCDTILRAIGFPINLDSKLNEIVGFFGDDYSQDDHLVNCVTYKFLYRNCYVAFDISDEKIVGIAIICSRAIIEKITEK